MLMSILDFNTGKPTILTDKSTQCSYKTRIDHYASSRDERNLANQREFERDSLQIAISNEKMIK